MFEKTLLCFIAYKIKAITYQIAYATQTVYTSKIDLKKLLNEILVLLLTVLVFLKHIFLSLICQAVKKDLQERQDLGVYQVWFASNFLTRVTWVI